MSRFVRPFGLMASFVTLVIGLSSQASATLTTIYSNNPSPGDSLTGPSPNTAISNGWYYTDVRSGATIGINTAQQFDGNGSVVMSTSGSIAKADVTYDPGSSGPDVYLGQLKDLTAFSYSWLRTGGTTDNYRAPALRLLITDGQGNNGFLIYEPTYNGYPSNGSGVPIGTWITSNALNNGGGTGSGVFWMFPYTGPDPKFLSFNQWIGTNTSAGDQNLGNYYVYGINSGVGSGWDGTFNGAVDNITIGFNGSDPTTFNFEVQPVPEPTNVVLGLIAGGLTLAAAARRRFQRA